MRLQRKVFVLVAMSVVAFTAQAWAAPGVPVRVTPAPNVNIMTPNIANGGVPAKALRVQFKSDPTTTPVGSWWTQAGTTSSFLPPTNRVWVQKTATGSVLSTFAFPNGTFYWVSQACTGTDGTGCSSMQTTDDKFNVVIAPALKSPAMNTVTTNTTVTLEVTDGPGITWNHVFRVAPRGQLNTAAQRTFTPGPVKTQLVTGLTRGVTYDWTSQTCVAVTSGCTSQLFVGTFTVAAPKPPALVAPADGELVATLTPTLRISDIDGLDWHRKFEVYKVVNGFPQATPIWSFATPSPSTAVVTPVLESGATYEWTAATCTGPDTGCTAFATRHRFAIGSLPPVSFDQTIGRGCDNALGSTECDAIAASHGEVDPVVDGQNAGLTESATDMALEGRGFQFSLRRSYASVDTAVTRFGAGWAFNLGMSATLFLNGDVQITADDGQRVVYVKQSNGSFTTPAGVTSTLNAVTGGYVLTTLDGSKYSFDSQGRLTKVVDETNQGITLAYNAASDLTTITTAESTVTVPRVVTVTTNPTTHLVTKVTLPDGRFVSYTYRTDGRLETVTDMAGNVTTYRYDAQNRLDGVREQIGTITRWSKRVVFNLNGQVISSQDAEGKTTSYSWSGTSAPMTGTKTTTDPRGKVWTETYVGGMLTSTTNPLGETSAFTYDADLNLVSSIDGNGNVTSMTYDANGNMLTKTSPGVPPRTETWEYNPDNTIKTYTNARGNATAYTYNAQGLLATETDAKGGVTTTTYTTDGQIATVKDARNNTTTYGYYTSGASIGRLATVTTPLGKVTSTTYDAKGRVATVTDPDGGVTTTTYDNQDRVLTVTRKMSSTVSATTTTTYDEVGRKKTDSVSVGGVAHTTTYAYDLNDRTLSVTDPNGGITLTTYDEVGNVATQTTPEGEVTSYTYDAAGRMKTKTSPRGNVAGANAAAFTTSYEYDHNGNRTKETDPLGNVTTTVYDAADQVVTITDPLGNVTSTEYDTNGNQVATVDAIGRRTTSEYDQLDRTVATTTALGNRSETTYDAVGNVLTEKTPLGFVTTYTYDVDNRQVTRVDPRGKTWSYTYDGTGDRLTETDPLLKVTTWTYDLMGNQLTKKDALNHITTWTYDELSRQRSVTGPDATTCTTGAQCVGGKLSTVYGYDKVGNVVTITDPLGHVTTKKYDKDNRLTEKKRPLLQRTTYGYDVDGNQTTLVTARGNASATPAIGTITRTFDARGLLTQTVYGDGAPTVTRTYDAAGQLRTMQDGAGTETYTLDAVGRRTAIARSGGSLAGAFTYVYDDEDHVLGRAYPDAEQTYVAAEFDADGRQVALVKDGARTTFAYDESANLVTTTFPASNGHVETRTYDNAGRLTRVRTVKGTTVLVDTVNTLDAVGNPTRQDLTRGTTTTSQTFAYDAADRLIRDCINTTAACTSAATTRIEWTYDLIGNRKTQNRVGVASPGSTTYVYNNNDELTSTTGAGAATYSYDPDGNMTVQGTVSYQYNLDNLVKWYSSPSATVTTYTYDGEGKRLTRTTAANPALVARWDTVGDLPEMAVEQNASDGSTVRLYAQGPIGPVSVDTSTVQQYFHPDQIGSIRSLTDAAGAVQRTNDFDPFGEPRASTAAPGAPGSFQLFAGEQYDGEQQGNYHLRARQYVPGLGRFTSGDPVDASSAAGSQSTYLYGNQAPARFVDPRGESPIPGGGPGLSKWQIARNFYHRSVVVHEKNWVAHRAKGISDLRSNRFPASGLDWDQSKPVCSVPSRLANSVWLPHYMKIFTVSCSQHDFCYNNAYRLYTVGSSPFTLMKIKCDHEFKRAMFQRCSWWGASCNTHAGIFYAFVRKFGDLRTSRRECLSSNPALCARAGVGKPRSADPVYFPLPIG